MEKTIKNIDGLLEMLDSQFRPSKHFWDPFYSDRQRPIPFFANKPDENLVSYLEAGIINTGKAVELGCGPGRNALFLARSGFSVDAFDWDVYQEKTMKGGLAFTEEKIRYLLSDHFDCVELRKMRENKGREETFGVPFLWTSLWRRK